MAMLSIQKDRIPPALPPLAFVFKLNPLPDDVDPFLVPRIDNPDFDLPAGDPPGIKQFVNGDVGITQLIFDPILDPINQIYAASESLPENSNYAASAIPEDAGMRSFEKMTIQSFLESQKPTLEMIKIIIDMLGVVEDAIARFLGTSIKIPIINKWVGIPSKNPLYTKGSLNYKDPTSKNKDYIQQLNTEALNTTYDGFPLTENSYGGIPGGNLYDFGEFEDPKKAYYIGYFNEDGEKVIPPNWIQNSNKWFGSFYGLTDEEFQQPETLSNIIDEGVAQLTQRYNDKLQVLYNERSKMVTSYDEQIKKAFNDEERTNLSNSKEYAVARLNEVIDEVLNGVDQTVYSEWFTKNAASQLKSIYQDPFQSTAQEITDNKGRPQEPYVKIPKLKVKDDVEVEIPIVEAENQIIKGTVGKRKRKRTVIKGLNTTKGPNGDIIVEPEIDQESDNFYFTHTKVDESDQLELKKSLIADDVKRFFMAHDYEIVLQFEIRKVTTGEILRTEEEILPQQIDFENDYKLRLVRVSNEPLTSVPADVQLSANTNQETGTAFYYSQERLDEINSAPKDDEDANAIRKKLIPESYDDTIDGINKHSADLLDAENENGLFESEIAHGVDARFADFELQTVTTTTGNTTSTQKKLVQVKNKTFWLVEAFKIDENGFIEINGKKWDTNIQNENDKDPNASNATGKEWYGLLDKFTVIPIIASKLFSLIAQKLIPLMVKVLQILTNPRKLADLVFLIIEEKISKLFGAFNTQFDEKSSKDRETTMQSNVGIGGAAGKYNYQETPESEPVNVADGKADIKIFGFYIGIAVEDGTMKLVYSEDQMEREHGDKPDQPIFRFILNAIKMPFDIIKKIVEFFFDFIKKLVNPLKMLQAIIDFVTFKWLLDILSPDTLAALLGIAQLVPNLLSLLSDMFNHLDRDEMNKDLVNTLNGENVNSDYVQVSIYDVFRNGEFIRQETEEQPIDNLPLSATQKYPPQIEKINPNFRDLNDIDNNGNKTGPFNPPQPFPLICGERNVNLNMFFPLPIFSASPKYNICELMQVQLKPFEEILGMLGVLEGFVNGIISIPFSFFGLAPHIPMPEVDFTAALENTIEKLKETTSNQIAPIVSS
jgi:hypothetical protein